MKNVRIENLSKESDEQFSISTECPAPNSLFFQLWSMNAKKVTRHIETSFNSTIKNGDLSFIVYGGYVYMNECYKYHMAHNFIVAAKKAKESTLKALLQQLFITSKISRRSFNFIWGNVLLKDNSMIHTDAYFKFLRKVATKFEPIYSLIPLMAREYLACWLPLQLGALDRDNPYSGFVDKKCDTSSVYSIGNFVENYLHNYPNSLDTLTTRKLYAQTIDFEIQKFSLFQSKSQTA